MEENDVRQEIAELKDLILNLSKSLSRQKEKEEEYIDVDEVCQLTGWKRNTVYQYHRNKHLPSYKFGGVLRFKRSEILKWMENMIIPGKSVKS